MALTGASGVRASLDAVCYTNAEGEATCGYSYYRHLEGGGCGFALPDDQYLAVVPMADTLCGLNFDGRISCWDRYDGSPSTEIAPPDDRGPYRDLCLANDWGWGCALDAEGHAQCFGQTEDASGRWPWTVPPPEDVVFTSLSCGAHHVCGLTDGGEVRCFGNDDYGQASPPQ